MRFLKYSFLFTLIMLALCSFNPYIDDTCKVKIIKVYDGDSYAFRYKGELIKIRLLGADTYETRIGKRLSTQAKKMNIKEKTALKRGIKAKSFAEEILLNKKVLIIRDKNEMNLDNYNRLLRYLIVDNIRFDSLMILNNIYFIK